MAETAQRTGLSRLMQSTDLVMPALLVVAISFMLFPLPRFALDLSLVLNFTFSIMILFITLYVTAPLQFSSFPPLLLIATLMRLSLNVAASRLILTEGNTGSDAAGRMIEIFGQFVGGNDAIVGLVVFVILIVIQFVVITNGAQRVSEVAARFTLDAMPGKQMAIDADLNSGIISEEEARERRANISKEANFYGAMDGASKFVRGDAIAAVIIVIVNIIGGFAIGMWKGGLSLMEVMERYTLLTIGDGLVTQIPALMIATATGIIVTRTAADSNLGADFSSQMVRHSRPLGIASVVLAAMALVFPGWSKLPLLIIAAITALAYVAITRRQKVAADLLARKNEIQPAVKEPENVSKLLSVDAMELEIGFGLIPLVEEAQGGDLLDRITMIRRQTALELGLVVPPIRIRDNMQLASEGYAIKIRGTQVAYGELATGRFLAINSTGTADVIKGTTTKEPTFGLPAIWIDENLKPEAESKGYTVVDLPSVIATHLTEIVKSHAGELLTRQDVQKLVDNVRTTNGAVVDELIPNLLGLGDVQKVLQNLLKERVSIRDLVAVLETLADNARNIKDPDILTEFVRQSLYRTITKNNLAYDGAVHAVTLDPHLEQKIMDAVQRNEAGTYLSMDPLTAQKIIASLSKQIENINRQGFAPLVLCSPTVRLYFKRLIEKLLPNLIVLSYNELDPKTEIQSTGIVSINNEN